MLRVDLDRRGGLPRAGPGGVWPGGPPSEPARGRRAVPLDAATEPAERPRRPARRRRRRRPAGGRDGSPRRQRRGSATREDHRLRAAAELLDLEQARLTLRAEHGLAVDRGRPREAIAVLLADLEEHGAASRLVGRLTES